MLKFVNELPITLKGYVPVDSVQLIQQHMNDAKNGYCHAPAVMHNVVFCMGDELSGISTREFTIYPDPLEFPAHFYGRDTDVYYELHTVNGDSYMIKKDY